MRILIFPGGTDFDNLGDLAMLQMALARLRALWPDARLQVLTTDPAGLARHCPGAEPVSFRGSKRWFRVQALPCWCFPRLPSPVRAQFPLTPRKLWRLGAWAYPPDYRQAREFAEALFGADLLVLAGCGLLNDEFSFAAIRVLNIFAAAARCGIPTAMLGQGLGPMNDGPLWQRAAEVLPQVGAIHLREKCSSLPLLQRLGVAAGKVAVTGDDAVELSFNVRRARLGSALGVNLRLANYAGINATTVDVVRTVLAEKTRQLQARPLGLPILIQAANSDVQIIRHLAGETAEPWRGGHGAAALQEVLRRTGECRVIVTGSYHAGVFGLAQGVPVVAVAQSKYYLNKFAGLADGFGAGCTVLRADDAEIADKLRMAIDRSWNEAEALREKILNAAEAQVRAARTAYEKLPGLLRR